MGFFLQNVLVYQNGIVTYVSIVTFFRYTELTETVVQALRKLRKNLLQM